MAKCSEACFVLMHVNICPIVGSLAKLYYTGIDIDKSRYL